MPKPDLLFLSLNDGSDTRINKEVRTLAGRFTVHYVGIGRSKEQSFVKPFCGSFTLISGHHRQKLTFLKYWKKVAGLLLSKKFASVHVINEQLVLLFYPLLYRHRRQVVLDIFDSIFLRLHRNLHLLRQITYRLPKTIIVTDDNRRSLMPDEFMHKVVVVENFPYRLEGKAAKVSRERELLIFYNGSMTRSRGTDFLRELLQVDQRIRVKMAGWVYDEPTKALAAHPQVDFMGVVSQQESMRVAAQCDYILSMYEPVNQNNINASPNKVYDAIQAMTPVIINREVKIAGFVEQQGIGYVLESFYRNDPSTTATKLIARKNSFTFNADLLNRYTWESVQDKLLAAHTG